MNDLPAQKKIYDLILWLTDRVDSFPRAKRHTLGSRMENVLYDLLETGIQARYTGDRQKKIEHLNQANIRLEMLRYFIRISHEKHLISRKQYKYAAERIDDIGRSVGGWIKDIKKRA